MAGSVSRAFSTGTFGRPDDGKNRSGCRSIAFSIRRAQPSMPTAANSNPGWQGVTRRQRNPGRAGGNLSGCLRPHGLSVSSAYWCWRSWRSGSGLPGHEALHRCLTLPSPRPTNVRLLPSPSALPHRRSTFSSFLSWYPFFSSPFPKYFKRAPTVL